MATIKSSARDKPRHSASFLSGTAKKGGAGGRGTWGSPEHDYKYFDEDIHAIDKNDPNYDDEEDGYKEVSWAMYEPVSAERTKKSFLRSIDSASTFKAAVHDALNTFFSNHEMDDFVQTVKALNRPELHHELAKMAISQSLDMDDASRLKVAELLKTMSQMGEITPAQMAFAFRRLYNHVNDLSLDVPNALSLLNQFTRRATLASYLDSALAESLQLSATASPSEVAAAKASFGSIVDEFISSEELDEAVRALNELNAKELHHEFVKVAIQRALDHSNRECELTSRLLGAVVGDCVSTAACESGFEALIDRVEDLQRDCPNVLRILSTFLARAVIDECIPPAFVQRIHLHEGDMGSHVLQAAAALLQMPHAASRLSDVWGPSSYDALKTAVADLVAEYLDVGSLDEALRSINDLGAPRFRHEVVKKVFVAALDHNAREMSLAKELIERIARDAAGGGREQARKGIHRIACDLEEISKDAPHAPNALTELQEYLKSFGHNYDD